MQHDRITKFKWMNSLHATAQASPKMQSTHCCIDFKSSGSLLLFKGVLGEIPADYATTIDLVPFESQRSDLEKWRFKNLVELEAGVPLPRTQRVERHKIINFLRYAKLNTKVEFGDFQGSSHVLLVALQMLRRREKSSPEIIWSFCENAFAAFHDENIDHEKFVVVLRIVQDVAPECTAEELLNWIERFEGKLVRADDEIRTTHKVFGTPCLVAPNRVMAFQPLAASLIRFQLHKAGLSRNRHVIPDAPVAFIEGGPPFDRNALGMPGTGDAVRNLQRYTLNSKNPRRFAEAGKRIDFYVDIKSPHAWIAVEMTRAIEEDFDVHINILPFDLALADVYGDARAELKTGKSRVPAPKSFKSASEQKNLDRPDKARNDEQRNIVKWTYQDLRHYASLRGMTLFGTEKVWDSTLILKAMIFCREVSKTRALQDRFVDIAFEKLWRRDLNLEDFEEVQGVLSAANIDTSGFAEFCRGSHGEQVLGEVLREASCRGVFGVPSYYFDNELFWGKEHISLIRLKLFQQGLALRENVPIHVPYLWRPDQPSGSHI